MQNLRYKAGWKKPWLARFEQLLERQMPCCGVRHAF
jgi:spore photoproduct lyase